MACFTREVRGVSLRDTPILDTLGTLTSLRDRVAQAAERCSHSLQSSPAVKVGWL